MQLISAVVCFALLFFLSSEQASSSVHRASDKNITDCLVKKQCMNPDKRKLHKNVNKRHTGYTKDTWNVYFKGKKIEQANPASFKILTHDYAKDTWNVYFKGKKIEKASPTSFDAFNYGYAKDTWNVYFNGEIIKGASSMSFVPLTHGYAKDNWNVYYRGETMKGASPQTFALSHG